MKGLKIMRRPLLRNVGNHCCRYFSSEKDYVQSPVYPKIQDVSDEACRWRKKEEIYSKFRDLHTVEEKLFAVNLPKYYGWKSLILREGVYPYDFLPFVQHVTRTKHLRGATEDLLRVLGRNKEEVTTAVEALRQDVQEALLFQLKGRRWQVGEDGKKLSDGTLQDLAGKSVVKHIHSVILSSLSSSHPHLFDSVVDYEPRVEGFWLVGGFHKFETEVLNIEEKKEKKKPLTPEEEEQTKETWIQYFGHPCLQIRSEIPLLPIDTEYLAQMKSDLDDKSTEDGLGIPSVPYDPTATYGLAFERRHGTNITGCWPGDSEFGLLSYHLCGHLLDRPPHFGLDETTDTISAQAILASFSWLRAQAAYLGFTPYDELTYPLVSQGVVTDGRYFSVQLYQLNTLLLHSNHTTTNPRTNISLILPHQPLYQDIQDNQFVGWNDEVLERLIVLYLNQPKERVGVNMKPYIHATEDRLEHIEDSERRSWLHDQFRHMYSNRPRHRLPYEIYDWERIYKIKFETRPMDARLRPFELDCNPLEERKYYQHMHKYIPRSQRPRKKHWTGWRAKFAKTYYPEIEF